MSFCCNLSVMTDDGVCYIKLMITLWLVASSSRPVCHWWPGAQTHVLIRSHGFSPGAPEMSLLGFNLWPECMLKTNLSGIRFCDWMHLQTVKVTGNNNPTLPRCGPLFPTTLCWFWQEEETLRGTSWFLLEALNHHIWSFWVLLSLQD